MGASASQRCVSVLIGAAAIFAGSAHAEPADHLTLYCAGVGSKTVAHSAVATVYGRNGPVFGNAESYDSASSPERVTVVIEGASGKVHLPPWLVPGIHGGSDGWFKLTSVDMQPDEIHASFGINFINHPHFTIDRHSGEINMSGFAHLSFEGNCERGPDADAPPKF